MNEQRIMREGMREGSLKGRSPNTVGRLDRQSFSDFLKTRALTICLRAHLSKTDSRDCDEHRGARVKAIPHKKQSSGQRFVLTTAQT